MDREVPMQRSFDESEMALLTKVIDDACLELGCDDVQREIVATRVLSFAAKGARDYATLFAIAMFERDALRGLIA
jgi:hypothetical protein